MATTAYSYQVVHDVTSSERAGDEVMSNEREGCSAALALIAVALKHFSSERAPFR